MRHRDQTTSVASESDVERSPGPEDFFELFEHALEKREAEFGTKNRLPSGRREGVGFNFLAARKKEK